MKVFFTNEFINDLKSFNNITLVKQVFSHIIDNNGDFKKDAKDHRYTTIKDAWIRYISKGNRVIYIQQGEEIYLYRAGTHDIEEKVKAPSNLQRKIGLGSAPVTELPQRNFTDFGLLLKTTEQYYLRSVIRQMFFLGHFNIILISPFISFEILNGRSNFGRFLDRAVDDGTEIVLLTCPPDPLDLPQYNALEDRGIFVHFLSNLHSKLYIFDIDPSTLNKYHQGIRKTAILGSSNLTVPGFALGDEQANYELCYKLPEDQYYKAVEYAQKLIKKSLSYKKYEYQVRKILSRR